MSFFEALHGFPGMTWTVDSFSPARFSRRRTWHVRVPSAGCVPFWGFRFFHASTTILPDTGVLGQIKTAGIREPPFPLAGLARFPRPVKRYNRNYNVEFDPGSG